MSLSLYLYDHQFTVPKDANEKLESTAVEKYRKFLSGLKGDPRTIASIEIEKFLKNLPADSVIVTDINKASHALVHCKDELLGRLETETLERIEQRQVILCITTQRPGYPPTKSNKVLEDEKEKNKGRVILYARRVDALSDDEVTREFFVMPYSQARAAARGRFNDLNQGLRRLLQGRTVKLLTSLMVLCYGYLELIETTAADRERVNEARNRMGFIEPRSLNDRLQMAPEDLRMLKAKVGKTSWWLTPFAGSYSSGSDGNRFDFETFSADLCEEWEMAGGTGAEWEQIKQLIALLEKSLTTTAQTLANPANSTVARIVAETYIAIEGLMN